MSHLQYFDYEGFGARVRKDTHYSQAVKIGDTIKISGQGGWDRITESITSNIGQQVDQAFENVQVALEQAGGKGWEEVYETRMYFLKLEGEVVGHVIRNLRKYCPNHQPLLTAVGVAQLFNGMVLEIEAAAHHIES